MTTNIRIALEMGIEKQMTREQYNLAMEEFKNIIKLKDDKARLEKQKETTLKVTENLKEYAETLETMNKNQENTIEAIKARMIEQNLALQSMGELTEKLILLLEHTARPLRALQRGERGGGIMGELSIALDNIETVLKTFKKDAK